MDCPHGDRLSAKLQILMTCFILSRRSTRRQTKENSVTVKTFLNIANSSGETWRKKSKGRSGVVLLPAYHESAEPYLARSLVVSAFGSLYSISRADQYGKAKASLVTVAVLSILILGRCSSSSFRFGNDCAYIRYITHHNGATSSSMMHVIEIYFPMFQYVMRNVRYILTL